MTGQLQQADRWNFALLSVYYHGRQNEPPLRGQPPPLGVWSLARAVSVLATAPIGPMRLALADLCRTRANRSTATVAAQMTKLVLAYELTTTRQQRIPGSTVHGNVLPAQFENIFKTKVKPEDAYVQAIGIMLTHETPPGPPNRSVPALISYSVSAQ